jgi:hypothetical protein
MGTGESLQAEMSRIRIFLTAGFHGGLERGRISLKIPSMDFVDTP